MTNGTNSSLVVSLASYRFLSGAFHALKLALSCDLVQQNSTAIHSLLVRVAEEGFLVETTRNLVQLNVQADKR